MACTICMQQFQQNRQPKVLSCGHTFCLDCIETWFKTQQEQYDAPRDAVQCPVCRTNTSLPKVGSGVASLPTNFALLEVVEESEASVVGGGDDASALKKFCLKHTGKPMEYSCETCNGELVCGQCVRTHHRPTAGHQILSLTTIVEREKTEKVKLQKQVLELQQKNRKLTEKQISGPGLTLFSREKTSSPDGRKTGGVPHATAAAYQQTGAVLKEAHARLGPVSSLQPPREFDDGQISVQKRNMNKSNSLPTARLRKVSKDPPPIPSKPIRNRPLIERGTQESYTTPNAGGLSLGSCTTRIAGGLTFGPSSAPATRARYSGPRQLETRPSPLDADPPVPVSAQHTSVRHSQSSSPFDGSSTNSSNIATDPDVLLARDKLARVLQNSLPRKYHY